VAISIDKTLKAYEKLVQARIQQRMAAVRKRVCARLEQMLERIAEAEALGVDMSELREIILNMGIQFKCFPGESESRAG
jgi:hypothetical protein